MNHWGNNLPDDVKLEDLPGNSKADAIMDYADDNEISFEEAKKELKQMKTEAKVDKWEKQQDNWR